MAAVMLLVMRFRTLPLAGHTAKVGVVRGRRTAVVTMGRLRDRWRCGGGRVAAGTGGGQLVVWPRTVSQRAGTVAGHWAMLRARP